MTKQFFSVFFNSLFLSGMFSVAGGFGQTADAAPNAATGGDADVKAVKKASAKFYSALNAMFKGDPKPFQDVWWHTEDGVYLGADGAYNVGWKLIYANWKKQAAIKIGGKVKADDIKITVGKQIAVTNQIVTGVNFFNGVRIKIKLRATSVFRKKEGVWKMICHHVDVIPNLRAGEKKQK